MQRTAALFVLLAGCASKPGATAAAGETSADSSSSSADAGSSSSTGTKRPTVVVHGHRGDRGSVPPGNTIPSFSSALGYGVDVLEGDLQITRDGSVVFGHDDDLRTTGCAWAGEGPSGSALVSNMTDAEVAQWDCHPELDGVQAPPPLRDVLALDAEVGLNLELKRWGADAADVYLPALIAEDEACGGCIAPRLIIQSFDWVGLQHVHDTYGAFDVRLSLLAQADRPAELEAARNWADIWSPNQDIATPDAIEQAHAWGYEVAPWTVNDEADMRRLIDAGVDAVITDVPNVLLEVLGR